MSGPFAPLGRVSVYTGGPDRLWHFQATVEGMVTYCGLPSPSLSMSGDFSPPPPDSRCQECLRIQAEIDEIAR